jgi:glycosyltransferase involved in cell wall biosynthesis
VKKNRVFVGPGNTAGGAMYAAKSLRLVGIYAISFSYNAHPFGYTCDHDNLLFKNPFPEPGSRTLFQKMIINKNTLNLIWIFQKICFFIFALFKFDTFIFISHDTFFKNNIDLFFLKYLNKKIAFLFMGCAERDPKATINLTDGGICSFCTDIEKQEYLKCYKNYMKGRKIRYISRYANIIFAHRDTISFVRDKSKIKPFYCLTDFTISKEELNKKYSKTTEILISHIPSNSKLKGTESVELAIKNLRLLGYKFQFFSDRVLHSDMSAILKRTHILIDQFSIGPGLLAIEGMASGCVVICRTAKWFREDFPGLPFVSCESEELVNTLIGLLSQPQTMLSIAERSVEYYLKNLSLDIVGFYFKRQLNLI